MKMLIIVSAMLSVSSVIAAPLNYAQLYESLNVEESDVSQGEGTVTLEKTAGGITCQSVGVIYPGAKPSFSCTFSSKELDSSAIYSALSIKEVDASFGDGASVLEKTVSTLSCKKTTVIYPGAKAKFKCTVSLDF